MPWSTPPTAVFQQAPPYTWWNTYVRDNMLETAVAKATTSGYHFVSVGPNIIAERAIVHGFVDTTETTTSTAFVDLATPGPSATLTTGTRALVWINAQSGNSAAGGSSASSYGVSGASTLAPADTISIVNDGLSAGSLIRGSVCDFRGVTSGVNTFYMQYRVGSGTGTFLRRRIQVMGL